MSTRAYKNAKFNGNTKKNYAYTPEYIAHRFTRGGSLKTAYCDHNYVGDVESTFSLKRSPAVYKGASCEFVYNPPPEAGPAGLALEIIKPEAGPVGINLEVVKPEAGPTGIDLEHMAPVAGPVGVSVDNLNPSAGPTDLSLEHLKPQAGPVGIDVTAIKPQAGPIGIDLELLAPSAGPTGIDPTIAHPQAGPTGINISEVKPQTGPIGLDLEILKPASGPTGVSLDIVGPATGPTGLGLTSSPTAVPEDPVSTSFSSFSWTPAEHAVSYSIEYIPWGIDQFICPNFLQEPFSSTVGINEPAEVSGITGNAIDGITWGTDISHPGSMPFRAARIVAVFKSGYRTYGDTFMVFQDVTQEIGGDYPGGAGLEVGSDSDVWTQDFITSLAFVDWQPAGTNVWKLRGTINSDLVRQVRVFNYGQIIWGVYGRANAHF